MKIEATGFQVTLVTGVTLLANRTARVDVTLSPKVSSQTVDVAAEAPVINSENATIGNILDSRTITEVPLNGRTLDRLVRISAGVTSDSASNPKVAGSAYWGGIQFNVDGRPTTIWVTAARRYSYRDGLTPFVGRFDGEFKIDSSSMSRIRGIHHSDGRRQSDNQFHGSALWFNRNKEFTAKNFFADSPPL